MGGVKNEVCKFKAINIAKKYGFTPKNSTSGKNIGTNIINISIKLPITLSVDSKNYSLSEKLEKKLHELDLVSNYYIDSFTNEKIIYKIIYNSTPDKFISEFTSNNFKLNTSNSIWSVEWKI